jgi:ribose transport system substrate-binding protein
MKKLKFLISLHTTDNDFQRAQATSAEEAAQKLGVDAEISFANNDAVEQSTELLKSIQNRSDARPDAIVLEPVSATSLPQVARAACAAGIGWVVLNRSPEYVLELHRAAAAPIFTISSDHTEIGHIQGKQFAALLPKGGVILYVEGPSQSSSAQKRTAGMLETKPTNVQLISLKGNWTEESAQKAVSSWLKLATAQRAAIVLIAAQDDSMARGARKAFQAIPNDEERRRWLKLPFTGCDGQLKTGQVWMREGWLSATIYVPPLAGQAIEILVKVFRDGIQPPVHTLTESYSIPALEKLVVQG